MSTCEALKRKLETKQCAYQNEFRIKHINKETQYEN